MIVRRNIRCGLLVCLALLGSAASRAQHGGGPGGGMGMGGGGGMRGGGRDGMAARVGGPALRSEPQLSLPGRWWDDKKMIKSLNLRPDQQEKMDGIFNANKGNLVSLYGNLQREQQRFVSMSREDLQDETKVFAEIDRVAQARADLEKADFHILLEIRKEMDPVQVAALDRAIANSQ